MRTRIIGTFVAALAVALLLMPHAARAASGGAWTDAPVQWNQAGAAIPVAPKPDPPTQIPAECTTQIRQAESANDRAVEKAGWKLFGATQSYSGTVVISALSEVDGMCRPMSYQYFVFVHDRFAGTLSPTPMASRFDGAASRVWLNGPTSLTVEYLRYKDSDPLCCPSKTSDVSFIIGYALEDTGRPVLMIRTPPKQR